MFTLQLPSSVPATWLLPMLGMALLSLLTCGSGLWSASRLRRCSLPLVHAILVIALLVPLAAPLAWAGLWAASWAPLRVVSTTAAAGPTPVTFELQPPKLALPQPRHEAPEPGQDVTSPAAQAALATPLLAEPPPARAAALVATTPARWPSVQGIERVIVAIWSFGTVYQLAWLAWGLRRVRRFRRTVQAETDSELLSAVRSAAEQLGMTNCPALGRSVATDTPLSLGLWRRLVVLPAEQGDARWAVEAWRPLLVHELAHIHRQDHLVGLMQRLALAAYWWNPLAWTVSRELSLVRELICDDIATSSLTANNRLANEAVGSRQYAGLLIDLAERVADRAEVQPDYVAALAAWNGPRDDLSRRIHRLLDPRRQVVTALSRQAQVACVRVDQVAAEPPTTAAAGKAAVETESADGDGEPAAERLEQTSVQPPAHHPLKTIGVAFQRYHAAHGRFPASSSYMNRDGKYPLSWRVAILPYIGEQDLYNQYRQDEPWDSEHNQTLLAKMPAVYRSPHADKELQAPPGAAEQDIDAEAERLNAQLDMKRQELQQLEDNDLVRLHRDWYYELTAEIEMLVFKLYMIQLKRTEDTAGKQQVIPEELERALANDADVLRLRDRLKKRQIQMWQMKANDLDQLRRDWYDQLATDIAAITDELQRAEAAVWKRLTTPGTPTLIGQTHYQGFAGNQTALGITEGVPLQQFTDGTSSTLLIVETQSTVPWTQPYDLPFAQPEDAKGALPFEGLPLSYLTADGAVHSMQPVDYEKLAKMITRAGGEPVEP